MTKRRRRRQKRHGPSWGVVVLDIAALLGAILTGLVVAQQIGLG